ncbi:MAG: cytochrome P450 [Rhodobacter sp.]|uniref:cytochrome P450 n=1 Tax=Pararhodobacter sp. TaxID=2127056 RepID=UPI001D9AB142|nr:cytochrome P450 [Pararhodobacter sp.]MCB1344692.1 cytochrome P450 [Paracoccaceae bacterium]MCC0074356.1 cytochrome P450 [Rhodobacter sp.]HPD91267.1 cytochrome P450 [Pararhodobacter sp.]
MKPADFIVPETEDFDSPHALFAELRGRCPVAWANEMGGFWAVTRHADICRVLTDWQTFTTTVQNVVPPVATTQRRPPLHLDPPGNIPYRNAILRFLSPKRIDAWRPVIADMVAEHLDPFLDAEGGDICADFSFTLPIALLAAFFRLAPEQAAEIRRVGAEFNMALQRQDFDTLRERSDALYQIAARLIADRKTNPQDPDLDPVSNLLAVRIDGESLPDDKILGALRQFLLVGIIAPTTFIGSMAIHLARHPEHHAELTANPDLVPVALEELLRLYTPYRGFARTARHDVELGGRTIRAGDALAVVFTSGNRDGAVFPDPDTYRLDRADPDLVTFGRGPHMCPGAPLARVLLAEVLHQIVTKSRRLVLNGPLEMTRWPEYGPLTVPLRVLR